LAGIQSIAQQPTRKFATKSQIGDPTSAIEMNSADGREENAGQQLGEHDQRQRERLPLVALRHRGDQTGQREQ
jgi:hypothetical protein